jgi:hypothetical protein
MVTNKLRILNHTKRKKREAKNIGKFLQILQNIMYREKFHKLASSFTY